jgi:hypothetical protein
MVICADELNETKLKSNNAHKTLRLHNCPEIFRKSCLGKFFIVRYIKQGLIDYCFPLSLRG